MEQPTPEVSVLLLADSIYRDDVSGKFHINGTRSYLGARSFPYSRPFLMIYAVLVDGRGETALRFRLIDVDEEREAVAEEQVTVHFHDPLDEVEVVLAMTELSFPDPGNYRL